MGIMYVKDLDFKSYEEAVKRYGEKMCKPKDLSFEDYKKYVKIFNDEIGKDIDGYIEKLQAASDRDTKNYTLYEFLTMSPKDMDNLCDECDGWQSITLKVENVPFTYTIECNNGTIVSFRESVLGIDLDIPQENLGEYGKLTSEEEDILYEIFGEYSDEIYAYSFDTDISDRFERFIDSLNE
jgi:hypothetical protein